MTALANQKRIIAPWIIAVLIAVITFSVLFPVLKCGFVNYDDDDFIVKNELVVSKTIDIKKIFTTVVAQNDYYPVTILTLAWNYQQGKLDPSGYHFWNLMLHVFNTLLVFFFIYLLTKRNLLMATIVSILFGIHPMHVESVAWATERKDVLFLFFFMGGLITYLYYMKSKKWLWYFITIILFILSCLSKGTAVVFPFILLLIDYLMLDKINKKNISDKIVFIAFAFTFMFVTYRLHQTGTLNNIEDKRGIVFRIITANYQLMMYAVKLIVPYTLSLFYQNVYEKNIPLLYYLSPLVIAAVAIGLYLLRKKKELIFGALFYFVSIVLMLQIILTGGGYYILSDRYTYLPSIGIFFIIAYLMNKVWHGTRMTLKYFTAGVLILFCIVYCFQTYSRTNVWMNCETLSTDAIGKDSTISFAYFMRGVYRDNNKRINEAMDDYTKSINLNPDFSVPYYNRGILEDITGNKEAAMDDYTTAININPNYAEAYDNRGWVYFEENKIDSAIADYKKAIRIKPKYANTYNNLGWLYSSTGNSKLAIENYTAALKYKPDLIKAENNRSLEKYKLGDYKGSLEDLNYLVSLNLKNYQLYYERGLTYLKLNNTTNACTDLKTANDLGSPDANDTLVKYCR